MQRQKSWPFLIFRERAIFEMMHSHASGCEILGLLQQLLESFLSWNLFINQSGSEPWVGLSTAQMSGNPTINVKNSVSSLLASSRLWFVIEKLAIKSWVKELVKIRKVKSLGNWIQSNIFIITGSLGNFFAITGIQSNQKSI